MKDLVPGAAAAFGRFVSAFLLPSAVAAGLFAFWVLPAVEERSPFRRTDSLGAAERLAALGVAAVLLALVTAVMTPAIHGVLEGYIWKGRLYARRVKHFTERWSALQSAVRTATDARAPAFKAATRELRLYPADPAYIMPTALGNRVSAAETYGLTRYGLDSVTLFYELKSSVDDSLANDVESSNNLIESLVGSVFLGLLFSIVSLAVAAWAWAWEPMLGAAFGLIVVVGSYWGAVAAGRMYITTSRALVNMGRKPLADKLGLSLPKTLEAEQEMWRAVFNYVYWGPGLPDSYRNTTRRVAIWDGARQQRD
jgi:hypothetical protein